LFNMSESKRILYVTFILSEKALPVIFHLYYSIASCLRDISSFFPFSLWLMYVMFVWIVYITRNSKRENWNFKYCSAKVSRCVSLWPRCAQCVQFLGYSETNAAYFSIYKLEHWTFILIYIILLLWMKNVCQVSQYLESSFSSVTHKTTTKNIFSVSL
jgi:hypothetical protein